MNRSRKAVRFGMDNLLPTLGHDVRVTKHKPFQFKFTALFVDHNGALVWEAAEELSEEFAAVDYRKMFEAPK